MSGILQDKTLALGMAGDGAGCEGFPFREGSVFWGACEIICRDRVGVAD